MVESTEVSGGDCARITNVVPICPGLYVCTKFGTSAHFPFLSHHSLAHVGSAHVQLFTFSNSNEKGSHVQKNSKIYFENISSSIKRRARSAEPIDEIYPALPCLFMQSEKEKANLQLATYP